VLSSKGKRMVLKLFYEMFPLLMKHFRLRSDCEFVHKGIRYEYVETTDRTEVRIIQSPDLANKAKEKEKEYAQKLEQMKKEDPGTFGRAS